MKIKTIILSAVVAMMAFSCTDLEEEIRGDVLFDPNDDVAGLLQGAYNGLNLPYQDQSRFWAASQHTTDETIGPTRGPDWDDGGVWRVLHDHTWTADHTFLGNTFNELLQVVFNTTNLLKFETKTAQQEAEARFLRAFVMFSLADGWGQVPFREAGEDLLQAPRVLTGAEALDFIDSELSAIINTLPDGPAHVANKDAARVLQMKLALNRGTFADKASPSFPAADMQSVITLADNIINSGKYSISPFYDNFYRTNDQISNELIYTLQNIGNQSGGNVRSRYYCGLHYNQNPGGWNGFATIADFYDKFEDGDVRKSADYDGVTDISGLKLGFLEGQQFNENGDELMDRGGNPLAFTREVSLIEAGANLEVTGVRVMKFAPDYVTGDQAETDYPIFRYADVLLMKAEALMRTGDEAGALAIVNDLRAERSATALTALSADALLDERGFELYWEGHRRQDMIRFGKYLDAYTEKGTTGTERLLFPIPNTALAVNPNLTQNPGY